jgi:hypothetical protein
MNWNLFFRQRMLRVSRGLIGNFSKKQLLIQVRRSKQGSEPIPPQAPQGGVQELKEKLGLLEKFTVDWKALSVAKFFSELSLPTKDKEERLLISAEKIALEKAIEVNCSYRTDLTHFLQTDPLNSVVYKDAADFHIRMGEYEEALFLLHKALL